MEGVMKSTTAGGAVSKVGGVIEEAIFQKQVDISGKEATPSEQPNPMDK